MRTTITTAVFLILLSPVAVGESNFLCIVDLVSGFHHDADRDAWQHATFLPGERFRVTEVGEDLYRVTKVDTQSPWTSLCSRRSDQTDDSFTCRRGTDEFHFNRKVMRFTSFRYFGYWNGSKDSLSISIGNCAPE